MLELLEPRLLLSAPPADVVSLKWSGQSVQAVAGQWVVSLADPSVSLPDLTADLLSRGVASARLDPIGRSQFARLTTTGASSDALRAWCESRPDVRYVEPNFAHRLEETMASRTPNDSSFSLLWGLHNTGQTGGTPDADIDAPQAWDLAVGSAEVVVGVIDTGIDYTHPDLAGNIWTNPGEVAGDGVDNDRNGYVDDVHGYDFAHDSSDPMDRDEHGTHVAGTIGAVGNNARGVAGINWTVKLMALGVLSDGGWIEYDDTIEALTYVAMMKRDHGVNVVVTNNSWGGGGFDTGLRDAFAATAEQGILAACAAGNGGWDGVGDDNDAEPFYPSGYDLPNLIAVAAADHNDRLTSWSNYGARTVDLAAPGEGIYSTIPGGQYASFSGTSMATPHVTGVAALLAAANPQATSAQIKSAILEGVDRIAALNGKVLTGGRLNAYGALLALGGGGGGDDTTPPRVVSVSPPQTSAPVDTITVDFSEDLLDSAVVAANFLLRDNGADNAFDTGDDTVIAVGAAAVAETQAGRVQVRLGEPLSPESYRLTIRGTGGNPVRDPAGNPLNGGADEVYLFEIREGAGGDEPNDALSQATATGLSGAGSRSFSAHIGDGAYGSADVDLYRFEAGAGDVVTADVDAQAIGSGLDPILRLFDAAGGEVAANDDHDGLDSYIRTTVSTSGTYYLGVSSYPNGGYDPTRAPGGSGDSTGDYELAIAIAGQTPPGPDPGPDAYGYTATPVSPAFEDISRTGRLGLGRGADDAYFVLTPGELRGFEFEFYGQAQTFFYVSSNGLITLGQPETAYENGELAVLASVAAIAPLWDDLVVDGSWRSAVMWDVRGGGGDQRLILQWNDCRFYGGVGDGQITFQAVLYEADGSVQFNYLDLDSAHAGGEGAGGTVGIKDFGPQSAGGRLLQVSVNDGPNRFVGTGKSTRITLGDPDGETQRVEMTTPAPGQSVQQGQTFRLEWIGGGADATLDAWRYGPGGWRMLAREVPAGDGGCDWDTAGVREGWYYFGAHVSDGGLRYSVVSPSWLRVVGVDSRLPAVAITSPTTNRQVVQGEAVTIAWEADDGDGEPPAAAVWAHSRDSGWFPLGDGEQIDAAGQFSWDTSSAVPGWYSFSVWAGDHSGWATAYGPARVYVTLPPAGRPTISLSGPAGAMPRAPGEPIEVRWEVDPAGGGAMRVYLWAQDEAGRWWQINPAGTDAAAGRFVWDTSHLASGAYSLAAWLGYGDAWCHAFRPNWLILA